MERHFRGLTPQGQISAREEQAKADALEGLVRLGGVFGPKLGPMPFRGRGVGIDDPTPRPFWAAVTDRDPAFEATLFKDVDAENTLLGVTYDETNGTAPHLWPFYAHLKANKSKSESEQKGEFETVLVTEAVQLTKGAWLWVVERGQLCTSPLAHREGDIFEANIPYHWEQIAQNLEGGEDDRGNWNTYRDGRRSTFDGQLLLPAFEVKGVKVPVDGSAKVLMWLGYDSQTYYLFTFFAGCADSESDSSSDKFTLCAAMPWTIGMTACVKLDRPIIVKVQNTSSAQSVAAGAEAALTFNNELKDTDAMWDAAASTRIVFTDAGAGIYNIEVTVTAECVFILPDETQTPQLTARLNGTAIAGAIASVGFFRASYTKAIPADGTVELNHNGAILSFAMTVEITATTDYVEVWGEALQASVAVTFGGAVLTVFKIK
jgi:hypothetical protein